MKLQQILEVGYAQSDIVKLTGNFYTGYEGEYEEQDVTVTVKRGKETRHKFDHELTRFLGIVKSVKGGEIANEIITVGTTARLSKESEGWVLNGFTAPGHKTKYGDTWVLFDPEYDTEYDKSRIAAVAFKSTKTFEQVLEGKTDKQIRRAKKRYEYLIKSRRLDEFHPRVVTYSESWMSGLMKVMFRVQIKSGPWLKQYDDDWIDTNDNPLVQGSLNDKDLPEHIQPLAQKAAEEYAEYFADQHGIPYVDFEVKWHTLEIKYNYY